MPAVASAASRGLGASSHSRSRRAAYRQRGGVVGNDAHVEDSVLAAAEFDVSVATKVVPLWVAMRGGGIHGTVLPIECGR